MRVEKKIEPFGSFDSRAAIFNYAIAIAGNVESGAERVVAGICRQGPVLGGPEPGEEDVPGPLQKSGIGFPGYGAVGGQSAVLPSPVFPGCNIAVPEIKFEKFPASSLPTATLAAAAIGRGLYLDCLAVAAATAESEQNQDDDDPLIVSVYGASVGFAIHDC